MPPDPPPDRERGKKTTINLRWERQMWVVDMSTTAGDDDQRALAAHEGSGEEGEDGKGDGRGSTVRFPPKFFSNEKNRRPQVPRHAHL